MLLPNEQRHQQSLQRVSNRVKCVLEAKVYSSVPQWVAYYIGSYMIRVPNKYA